MPPPPASVRLMADASAPGLIDWKTFQVDFPTRPYAGYIFDCDGTLAHSMPVHFAAWNHGLAAVGAPFRFDSHSMMTVAGMALRETVAHLAEVHGVHIDGPKVMAEKNAYFQAHKHTITPLVPVVEYARQLHEQGAKLAVASGGTRENVHYILKLIGILDWFPVVVTADDVPRAKPAPDLFLAAADDLGVERRACVVFEDSELGIEAARLAGMDWVRIPRTI